MRTPDVVVHADGDAHDAGRASFRGLGLHPDQGKLASFVGALGELHHLLVLASLAQRLHHRLMRDVVDARAEHKGDRHGPGRQQPEEVLRRQIRGERAAVRRTVRALALQVPHGGAGGHELQHVHAPRVHLHLQLHAHDAVRAQVLRFGLHAGHGELSGVIHGLGQHLQFLVLAPATHLQADVIDRRAENEAERLEAGLAQQHVLGHRQV